jgi:hypothetical protein
MAMYGYHDPRQDVFRLAGFVWAMRIIFAVGAVAAAKWAGIDRIGTLTFRHSFRSWLDSIGTPNCAAAEADDCQFCRHSDPNFAMRAAQDRLVTSNGDDSATAHMTENGYVQHRSLSKCSAKIRAIPRFNASSKRRTDNSSPLQRWICQER